MILPGFIHRHWAEAQPALLSAISVSGSSAMVLLAPEATTPAEYGALFVGFLIFIGIGVLGIAGFTATYIVRAMIKALADMGGNQAKKVFDLATQEEFDQRFKNMSDASIERSDRIVETLGSINEQLAELTTASKLLNQELTQQVHRGDELRAGLRRDVELLQEQVFGERTGRRRSDHSET